MTSHKETRELWADAMSGLMLLFAMIYHCAMISNCNAAFLGFPLIAAVFALVTLPTIPWFFLKSGMYSKTCVVSKPRIKRLAEHYLRPVAIFGLMGILLQFVIDVVLCHHTSMWFAKKVLVGLVVEGTTYGNGPMWFLISLFAVRFISDFFADRIRPAFMAGICLCLSVLHHYLSLHFALLPWWLGNICLGGFFFYLGKLFRPNFGKIKFLIVSLAFIVCVFVACILSFMQLPVLFFTKNANYIGPYLISIPFIVSCLYIFTSIVKYVSDHQYTFPLCSLVTKNAMLIYGTHWLVINVCEFFILRPLIPDSSCWLRFTLDILLCAIFVPLICHIVNKCKDA